MSDPNDAPPITYYNEDGTVFEGTVDDTMTIARHYKMPDGTFLEYVVLQPRNLAQPVQ